MINQIFVDKKLSRNEIDEILGKKSKPTYVNSTKDIDLNTEDTGEIINEGKKIVYLSQSDSQVKYAKACVHGYCPGFKKIVIASNGCPFSCEYCFLQATYRTLHPFIKINCNIDDLLKELEKDISKQSGPVIYNAGEMLDSLALDEFTRITEKLVPFFAKQKNAYLLLLTKSNNIKGLAGAKHNGHTILSWSINCQHIIDKYEHGTATLEERIKAALDCAKWGYRVRFRFDPLIIHEGWQENYKDMVNKVLNNVSPEMITIGSLRFVPSVKSFSSKRFPDSPLFKHSFTKPLEDGKIRYTFEERFLLYHLVVSEIQKINSNVKIGLCKEEDDMWKELKLSGKNQICNCLL